jgi:ComF family protein
MTSNDQDAGLNGSTARFVPPEGGRAHGVVRAAGGLWRRYLDLVYPPQCIACQRAVGETGTLCARCWAAMPFITRPFCERLGTPFAVDIGDTLLSPEAIAEPPVFGRARAVAAHDGVARDLVRSLKYGDRQELARSMASLMRLAARDILIDADVLVPVPLHWTRLWTRRFNQSALLCLRLGPITALPVALDTLRRVKRTRPQVGLSRAQRRENLQGAFRVAPEWGATIEGKRVVLVDDVLTTAATANACARCLLKAGAKSVDVAVFTRVVRGSFADHITIDETN